MGRHQGAEHAAAALVAVDLLRHASSGPSATGSSIRPGRWSSSHTTGLLGYSTRADVDGRAAPSSRRSAASKMVKLRGQRRSPRSRRIRQLLALARAGGKAAFGDNCAPCHGTGGAGAKGYPNLNDDDWIWGGKLDQIEQTIQLRRPLRQRQGARRPDAALRRGRHSEAGGDRTRRRLRALAVGPADRARA